MQAMDNAANSLHLRDASFSAYLSTADENFAAKIAESTQSPYLPLASTLEVSYPVNLGRATSEEGELSVFGAEKYFNMNMDDGRRRLTTSGSLKHRQLKGDQADLLHCTKQKIRPATPSASSDASWNSHVALLPRLLRTPPQNKQRKANAKLIFAGFGCNGSCSDKKSVYVDSNAEPGGVRGKEVRKKAIQNEPNLLVLDRTSLAQPGFTVKNEIHSRSFNKTSMGINRQDYYGYLSIKSGLGSLTVNGELADKKTEEDGRKSLEVFGSHLQNKGDVATNLERKLSVLTWDAIPKVQTVPAASEGTGMYEDNESDASSDLFEIENLSGSGHSLFNKQASDGMSSCTRYEPSEASIEWSVVTASAADFSVASDYDEKKPESAENLRVIDTASMPSRTSNAKSPVSKERNRSTGLLGCRSDKAVRVCTPECRTNDKTKPDPRWHHRLDSSTPLGKSQGENKVKDFEFPQVQHAFA